MTAEQTQDILELYGKVLEHLVKVNDKEHKPVNKSDTESLNSIVLALKSLKASRYEDKKRKNAWLPKES